MKKLLPVLLALSLSGCTAAQRARVGPFPLAYDYKVTLYSGGVAVREWHTRGKVHSESESDGYFFVDRRTGKLTEVAGTVVIERE